MKKFIGRLLVLAAVLMLAAVPAYADDTPSGTAITSDTTTLTTGSYYLADDVTLSDNIQIETTETVTIDLNGHTLTGVITQAVIEVHGTLTLLDSSTEQTGTITGGRYGISCTYTGTVYMTSGTISGIDYTGYGQYGTAVNNSGTFTMSGGTITGNIGDMAGGVWNYGTFNMVGGTISNNIASDGASPQNGGGVYNAAGTFNMSGGTITGCSAANGGGVYVAGGTFNMTGGTITGNTASEYGGGIYYTASATISGGTIYANCAGEDQGQDVTIESSSSATLTIADEVNSTLSGYRWLEETTDTLIDMAPGQSAPHYLTAYPVASFYTRTLTLDGDIGVNYYVDMTGVSEDDMQKYTVVFTGDGISYTATFNSGSYRDDWDGTKYYRFTVTVDSTQMATSFTAVLQYNDTTVQSNTYSVESYCKWAITNNKDEKDLCAALLNYGGYSQTYFESTGTLANANLDTYFAAAGGTWSDPVASEFTADLSSYEASTSGTFPSVITNGSEGFSASLVLKSQTVIRIYFNASSTEGLTVKVGNEELTIVDAGSGSYYVEYEVQASKLGSTIEFTISGGTDTGTVSYSAYAYIYSTLGDTHSAYDADESLVNVCKALYYYGEAAKEYSNWYKGTT